MSVKLKTAAWILILVGIAETAMLVYAIMKQFSFSGGSLFYCYAGYKLLQSSSITYKWVTRGIALFLALLLAGLLCVIATAGQYALSEGIAFELEVESSWLIAAVYFLIVPLLAALLCHPETRMEFGLPPRGSVWTLYLGWPRASGLFALGLVLMGALLGPHLLSNPFQAVADAIRSDNAINRRLGGVRSLALLEASEHNWTFSARVRARGPLGTGRYYVDVAPNGNAQIDEYAYEGAAEVSSVPRTQIEAAVPEATANEGTAGDVVRLLSTSFEDNPEAPSSSTDPLVQDGQLAWARDARARSGRRAINAIPEGNPGKLEYFARSMSSVLLSSRLDGRYVPFRVEGFSRVELEFWRLSTSNPSRTHNCLGSLSVDYRVDKGPWQSKMVYCGVHKSARPEWKQSRLAFVTRGKKELEIRFEYEFPPETRVDRTVVYLVDDLEVRGIR